MSDIILLASRPPVNFVAYEGKVYAVPQSLGPCNDTTWANPAVQCFENLEQAQAATFIAPIQAAVQQTGHFSLRQLEGKLMKVFAVTAAEIERDGPKYMYVFRDENNEKWMWSPNEVRYEFRPVETVAEADEVSFRCPLCFAKNGRIKGTHSVMVTFTNRNVPDDVGSRDSNGNPSRWNASGNTIDDLMLTPSILLDANLPPDKGCHWHGFVGSNGIPPGHAG